MRLERPARKQAIRMGAALLASVSMLGALFAAAPAGAHRLPAPKAGKGGVLTIAQQTEPDSLDNAHTILGASYAVFSNIYDTLVVNKTASTFAGEIASSWTISKNGLVYTFQIRKGLKFSNGDPLNADAVAFTFDRILNPATKSPDLGVIGPIKGVKATGFYTVQFTLSKPFAFELADLADPYAGIEDPAAVQKEGAGYGRAPVGSGPFMVKSWLSGTSITLVPNPYYHSYAPYLTNHGKPYLSELKFQFIANTESEVAAMQSGETNLIEQLPQQNYAQFKNSTQFHVMTRPALDINYLEFKTNPAQTQILPPFNDVRVRQAAGYALNDAAIVAAANFGLGQVEYGLIPHGEDAYDPALSKTGFHYNPAKARKLLAQAGYKPGPGGVLEKGGKPLAVNIWVFSQGSYPQDAQIMANEMNAVGFKAKITTLPIASFIPQYPKGNENMDVIGLGWSNSSILNLEMTLPLGSGGVKDPALVKVLNEAQSATNPKTRFQLYAKAQTLFNQNAWAIPMYSDQNATMYSTSVHNVVLNTGNVFSFVDTYVG